MFFSHDILLNVVGKTKDAGVNKNLLKKLLTPSGRHDKLLLVAKTTQKINHKKVVDTNDGK
jgi:hypothetical protein